MTGMRKLLGKLINEKGEIKGDTYTNKTTLLKDFDKNLVKLREQNYWYIHGKVVKEDRIVLQQDGKRRTNKRWGILKHSHNVCHLT